MASVTPTSRLYKDALSQFKRDAEERYYDSSKKLELLREFLAKRGSPEEAKAAAGSLKAETGKKWGPKKVGDAEIPTAWIDKIMANIGNFVEVGNYAMKGAPESVGLAWFAVKLTLSAIQSNYELYNFFGAGLSDISEIMILIPHYDRLYDEKSKAKSGWKPSPVVEKLFQDIIATYTAVLRFSFSIQRHITGGTIAKIRHGFKDFFGTSKEKFKAELDKIASLKQKVLEESQAIFQDKSLHQMEDVKGIVSGIEGTVNEIRSFQSELREMQEAQTARWEGVLQMFEDIKATTKPKTPWEMALQEFECHKEALKPLNDSSEALGDAIDKRHPETCKWIFENPTYISWIKSTTSDVFCLSGQQGSGKSILLASVVEQIDMKTDLPVTLLYLSCGAIGAGAGSKEAPTADQVCHTLLYKLYDLARQNEDDVKLLEDCNKVFKNPKSSKSQMARTRNPKGVNKDGNLPDFAEAFLAIAERLKLRIMVALDKVHNLSQNDQEELASKLQAILIPEEEPETDVSVKFLIGCRSSMKFHNEILAMGNQMNSISITTIDVGDFNDDDMARTLSDELKEVPGLTEEERNEAAQAILTKAGPRFAYINNIGVPFMREPFQRPLSRRLQLLPENMNNVYNDALHKMSSNYVDLLRTALTMALLAPEPPKVQEVMDAYHLTYNNRGPEVEAQARALSEEKGNARFGPPSDLEIAQLRDASGPFLRIEQQQGSDEYFVNLQDAARVREFCLHSAHEADAEARKTIEVCARCKSDLQESKTLSISEKEGHLDMALMCLRAMNNAVFQRRSTALFVVPLWSQSKDADIPKANEGYDETSNDAPNPDDDKSTSEQREEGAENETKEKENPDALQENAEAAEEPANNEEPVDNTGYDSDESMDDEDRGEVNFAPKPVTTNTENITLVEVRRGRYENLFWSDHILKAEELWLPEERAKSPKWAEIFSELDHWVSCNREWFYEWQKFDNSDNTPAYHTELKPLNLAAVFGLTSWAEHLLAKGADPNEKSGLPFPKTSLQMTAWRGDRVPMLKLLLEHGADPNVDDEYTLPAFHEWMYEDASKEVVEVFLKHGADTSYINKGNNWTVLHYFAWNGKDADVLELLLKETPTGKTPDINYNENATNKSTPLHLLLERREVPKTLLQTFLDHGADINKENAYSERPLQLATQWGDLATLQILCKDRPIEEIDDDDIFGNSALQQAAIGDHPKCIAFLSELGANVNMQNKSGRVALHTSAWHGVKECAEVLLAHSADPTIVDKHNRSVLFYACLSESAETAAFVLDTLLERKISIADIHLKTKRHRTPLRQAAGRGFDGVVDKLIKVAQSENKFDSLAINERDTLKGMTALHRAAWFGKTECVRLLLAAGADASIRDNKEKTALVLAYEQWALTSEQKAFEDIISLLVESDPAVAKADTELVAICAVNGSIRLLKQLVGIGSDLNRQDQYGWTPLELARKFHQAETEEFLKQQAAWVGMLPSRWAVDDRTTIEEDGKVVKHTSRERICISADKPLPAGLDTFYFEVTTEEQEDEPITEVAVGFCTIGGHAIEFPGWQPRLNAPSARSWGYHGDNGGLYISTNEAGTAVAEELGYSGAHTIGCGVDLNTRTIWFTRDGVKLESKFEGVQGRLFPLLGLHDDVVLRTNFTGPFVWKEGESEKKDGDEVEQVKTNGMETKS